MSKIQIDSCAAGPWNYDMSQTPKDGRDVFFLRKRGCCLFVRICFYSNGTWYISGAGVMVDPNAEFIAFAEIHLPEKSHE